MASLHDQMAPLLASARKALGHSVVDGIMRTARERLSADRVLASSGARYLEDAILRDVAQTLNARLAEGAKRDKEQELAFRNTCRERAGGQWSEDYLKAIEWARDALYGNNSVYTEAVGRSGISPAVARTLILGTDDFALNHIDPYHQSGSEGMMDWRYLFEYARFLKGALRDAGIDPKAFPDNAAKALKPLVCVFAGAVRNYDQAHDHERFEDYDHCFLEFLDKWDAVEYALGEDPFDLAAQRAAALPIRLLDERSGEASVVTVASLAYHLQLMRGAGASIVLPTERIGNLLGKSDDAARQCGSRVLKALRRCGLLEETKADWNHRRGEAKEYRFVLDSQGYSAP